MPIKAIIFDLEGTIIDTEPVWDDCAVETDVDQRLHLTQLFGGHIYSIEDIGFIAKPNPDIFLHAAAKLNVAPADCLVIEDSPHGVEAARRAGMQCAAIIFTTTKERLATANQVVHHYSEIKL